MYVVVPNCTEVYKKFLQKTLLTNRRLLARVVQLLEAVSPFTWLVTRLCNVLVAVRKAFSLVVKVTKLVLKLRLLLSSELSWSFRFW